VDDVKLLSRQLKPTAMKSVHEIAGQDKEQEPNEQDSIVDDRAPQERIAQHVNAHFRSPYRQLIDLVSRLP
jgi:hypothetical protein